MNISVTYSKDEAYLSEYFGDDAQIIDIEYKEDLHLVELYFNKTVYRGFANTRKRAINNVLKSIIRFEK